MLGCAESAGWALQLHSQLLLHQIERCCDGFVHVVVLVAAQAAAGLPIGGILARDDGLGQRVAVGVLSELEMLVLDDAGPGDFAFVVVDDGDALVILFVKQLALETEGAVLELAKLEIEERVDGTAVDDALGDIGLLGNRGPIASRCSP